VGLQNSLILVYISPAFYARIKKRFYMENKKEIKVIRIGYTVDGGIRPFVAYLMAGKLICKSSF